MHRLTYSDIKGLLLLEREIHLERGTLVYIAQEYMTEQLG